MSNIAVNSEVNTTDTSFETDSKTLEYELLTFMTCTIHPCEPLSDLSNLSDLHELYVRRHEGFYRMNEKTITRPCFLCGKLCTFSFRSKYEYVCGYIVNGTSTLNIKCSNVECAHDVQWQNHFQRSLTFDVTLIQEYQKMVQASKKPSYSSADIINGDQTK